MLHADRAGVWGTVAANQAFAMLRSVWKSRQLSLKTKLIVYKSNVPSVVVFSVWMRLLEDDTENRHFPD